MADDETRDAGAKGNGERAAKGAAGTTSAGQGAEGASPTPSGPPLKRHGDALLDGSGSRQGVAPDPALDSAPHE